MSDQPFKIDLGTLRSQSKETSPEKKAAVEKVAEDLGFVDRTPKKKRGRKPSPRTGQIHAKVLPDVATEVANEARRRGVQQGVIIEEAWQAYKDIDDNNS